MMWFSLYVDLKTQNPRLFGYYIQTIGGSKEGGTRDARPTLGPISFIAVIGKNLAKWYCFWAQTQGLAPSHHLRNPAPATADINQLCFCTVLLDK